MIGLHGIEGDEMYGLWQAVVWVFTHRRVVITLKNGTRIKYRRDTGNNAIDYRAMFQAWTASAGKDGKGIPLKLGDDYRQVIVNSADIAAVEIR